MRNNCLQMLMGGGVNTSKLKYLTDFRRKGGCYDKIDDGTEESRQEYFAVATF